MSHDDLDTTWAARARAVDWFRKPRRVRDESGTTWFPDASLNTCFNALDRHVVHGHGDLEAVVGAGATLSFEQLLERVAAAAGALQACGVEAGDRVVVHLPVVPEAVVALLASARIGAVHAAAPFGSGAAALAAHVDHHRPVVVVTAASLAGDVGPVADRPVLDDALQLATHQPAAVLVVRRPEVRTTLLEPRDVDWELALRAGAADPAGCVEVPAPEPLYAVPDEPAGDVTTLRGTGAHAVATTWAASHLLGLRPGTRVWAPGDLATEAGHAGVYGPLLVAAATVVHEPGPSGTVDADTVWRVSAEHAVTTLLLTSASLRALHEQDGDGAAVGAHDLSALQVVLVGGDPSQAETEHAAWLDRLLGVPVRVVAWPFPEPAPDLS